VPELALGPDLELTCTPSAKLDEQHSGDGINFPQNDPSSGMHILLPAIRSYNV
jgi:hypothetical protein